MTRLVSLVSSQSGDFDVGVEIQGPQRQSKSFQRASARNAGDPAARLAGA